MSLRDDVIQHLDRLQVFGEERTNILKIVDSGLYNDKSAETIVNSYLRSPYVRWSSQVIIVP